MKNKIEFTENDAIQSKQFINQTRTDSSFDKNQNLKAEQKLKIKSSKIIRGKVKIYNDNNDVKFVDNDYFDDKAELDIVSKRMTLFLILSFLSLLLLSLIILVKKNVL